MPTLLAFILLGMLFGSQGLNPLHAQNIDFAGDICSFALIFIMFYGGFGTRWQVAKPVVREAGLLASVGVIATAGLTGAFCHFALKWDWLEGLLLGSVLASTDAASVFSILRSRKLGLKNHTAPILEVESGSNDPCAYMLTVMILSIMKGSATGLGIAWMLFAQIAFGLLFGFGIAKAAAWTLEHFRIKGDGFDSLFIFAVAIASYAIPGLVGGNGFLSTYIVGVILGNSQIRNKKSLVNFFDGITGLMQVIIFFSLGLLAKPQMFGQAILPAIAIFLFMLLVARPLSVGAILTPFGKYPLKQQMLVSFVGLRGAASIVFAIMATAGNAALSHDLFSIVFCLVLISILLQGSLLAPVAKGLGMIDAGNNVLKTFNDYTEQAQMQFSSIEIVPGSSWEGKSVGDLNLPKTMLVALVLRKKERIIAHGDTLLQTGDVAIVVTKAFEDSQTYLIEKTVKKAGRRDGHAIKDVDGPGLVLLVRRGEDSFIPDGDTVLHAGDQLVLLRQNK